MLKCLDPITAPTPDREYWVQKKVLFHLKFFISPFPDWDIPVFWVVVVFLTGCACVSPSPLTVSANGRNALLAKLLFPCSFIVFANTNHHLLVLKIRILCIVSFLVYFGIYTIGTMQLFRSTLILFAPKLSVGNGLKGLYFLGTPKATRFRKRTCFVAQETEFTQSNPHMICKRYYKHLHYRTLFPGRDCSSKILKRALKRGTKTSFLALFMRESSGTIVPVLASTMTILWPFLRGA